MTGVQDLFNELEDPRAGRNVTHRLGDVLTIMVAAALCGQTSATEMAWFADLRREALRRIVSDECAPSHDTFSRLLRMIDPDALAEALGRFGAAFARAVAARGGPEVVACDGKALRRAYERGQAHAPALVVSAFAAGSGLVLGACPTAAGGEAAAMRDLVELFDLTGKIITADALHASHETAETIARAGADYVLGLKRNRPDWYDEAEALFDGAPPQVVRHETCHGRDERREATVLAAPEPRTAGHAAFGRIVSSRTGQAPLTRYFLLSRIFDASAFLTIARSHWSIENNLHWTLDTLLGEDDLRARKDNAPANIAVILRIARNILQMADHPKVSIKHRTRKCTWNDDYLVTAISHMR